MTSWLLSSGSLSLIIAWLLIGGLGVPLPEEVALLASGALVYHGVLPIELVLPLVVAAVLAGDLALFKLGQHFGEGLLRHRLFERLLPPARRARVETAYRNHGGKMVFVARHVAGLRGATFALAGILGMKTSRFLAWDALAAAISAPIGVGLGYGFALHLDRVRHDIAKAEHIAGLVIVAGAVVVLAVLGIRRARASRARLAAQPDHQA